VAGFTLLLALLAALLVPGAAMPAKTLEQKRAALDRVNKQRGALSGSLDDLNRQVDSLIGQLSGLRQREASLQGQLSAKQAELDRTTASLRAEQRHLEQVRGHLERALGVLRRWLVAVYKSDTPDVLALALQSASWSDVVAQNDYFNRIQGYEQTIAERVRALRARVREAVADLDEARTRLEQARNVIASQRDKVGRTRAAVEARHRELTAVAAARRGKLRAILGQKVDLERDILAAETPSGPVINAAPPVHGQRAKLVNGQAVAPAKAPAAVKGAIAAANRISTKPYVWGGGHGSFESSGYDCSGSVSYALHGGGLIDSPRDSSGLAVWGVDGAGEWITVYANGGHAWMTIAGLRFDTSGTGGNGPRWSTQTRSGSGYAIRHYPGL
jgi:cell wall-associated NlpC family hydrolase